MNENIDKYSLIVENFNKEREEFKRLYPLEKIKDLDLETYDKISKADSFMNMLEHKTSSLGSKSFGYNYSKVFYQKASNKEYDILDSVKNNEKYKYMSINDIFNIYKNELYKYIKEFDINNYDSLSDYSCKDFIASSNIIKMKLLLMYHDVNLTSCNAINMVRELLDYLGVSYSYAEDSVSLNIKLTNHILENDSTLVEKYPMCQISACIRDYYNEYVNIDKNYYLVQIDDAAVRQSYFDKAIYSIGWKLVGDFREFTNDEDIISKKLEVNNTNDASSCKSILSCFKKLKNGDRLILKENGTRENMEQTLIIAIGEVLDGYDGSYAFDREIGQTISVEWKVLDKPLIIDEQFKSNIIVKFNNRRLINDIEYKIKNINIVEDKKDLVGENIIYYGVPGCGKSRRAKDEAEKLGMVERVLFHPDYSYADFVGQILPVLVDDKPKYEFVPGPFTKILGEALRDREQHRCLIIEEINRGNASAIFGDVFQLLDRLKEDRDGHNKGDSEYPIVNDNILNYLKNIGLEETEVYIPSNLTIIATMNSSDQNVFPLDTAFKRRWTFKKISNIFNETQPYKDEMVAETGVSWENFVTTLNIKISLLSANGINGDDKQIGKFFLSKDEVKDVNLIAEKLLLYLWEDVVKFDRKLLFLEDYNTLDDLISDFVSNPTESLKVFGNLFENEKH